LLEDWEGGKLGDPCQKVRLCQDRMPVELYPPPARLGEGRKAFLLSPRKAGGGKKRLVRAPIPSSIAMRASSTKK